MEKSKLLATVAVFAMVFAVFAMVPAFADDSNAAEPVLSDLVIEKDQINGTNYVNQAIEVRGTGEGSTVTFMKGANQEYNIQENCKLIINEGVTLVIPEGVTLTIGAYTQVIILGTLKIEGTLTIGVDSGTATGVEYEGIFVGQGDVAGKIEIAPTGIIGGTAATDEINLAAAGSQFVSTSKDDTTDVISVVKNITIVMIPGTTVDINSSIACSEDNSVTICTKTAAETGSVGSSMVLSAVVGTAKSSDIAKTSDLTFTVDAIDVEYTLSADKVDALYEKVGDEYVETTLMAWNVNVTGNLFNGDEIETDVDNEINEADGFYTKAKSDGTATAFEMTTVKESSAVVNELNIIDGNMDVKGVTIFKDNVILTNGAIVVDSVLIIEQNFEIKPAVTGTPTTTTSVDFTTSADVKLVDGSEMTMVAGSIGGTRTTATDQLGKLEVLGGVFEITGFAASKIADPLDYGALCLAEFYGAYFETTVVDDATYGITISDIEYAIANAPKDGSGNSTIYIRGLAGSDTSTYAGAYEIVNDAKSLTIPAEMTVKVLEGVIIPTGMTVEVTKDAVLKIGTDESTTDNDGELIVNGKLIVNNNTAPTDISAETYSVKNNATPDIHTFTNLREAISDGEKNITLKMAVNVTGEDLIIPSDVKIIMGEFGISVQSVEMIVYGLIDASGTGAITTPDDAAVDGTLLGEVTLSGEYAIIYGDDEYNGASAVINGVFVTLADDDEAAHDFNVSEGTLKISVPKNTDAILSMESFATIAGKTNTATVHGNVVTDSTTLKRTVTDANGTYSLTINESSGKLTATTIELEGYSIEALGVLNTAVVAGDNIISVQDVMGLSIASTIASEINNVGLGATSITERAPIEDEEAPETIISTISIDAGKVTFDSTFNASAVDRMVVEAGAELITSATANQTFTAAKEFVLNGTLTVDQASVIIGQESFILDEGTIRFIDTATTSSTVTVEAMIIEGDGNVTIAEASESTIKFKNYVVDYNGTAARIIKIETGNPLTFDYIFGDDTYATAYIINGTTKLRVESVALPVDENGALVTGWYAPGGLTPYYGTIDKAIGADITYVGTKTQTDVYDVTIVVDGPVNAITLVSNDGKNIVMAKSGTNTFVIAGKLLAAGTYTVVPEFDATVGDISMSINYGAFTPALTFTTEPGVYDIDISLKVGEPAAPTEEVKYVWIIDGVFDSFETVEEGAAAPAYPGESTATFKEPVLAADGVYYIYGTTETTPTPEIKYYTYWIVNGVIADTQEGADLGAEAFSKDEPEGFVSWSAAMEMNGNTAYVAIIEDEEPAEKEVSKNVIAQISNNGKNVYVSVNTTDAGMIIPAGKVTLTYTYNAGTIEVGGSSFPDNKTVSIDAVPVPDNNIVVIDLGSEAGENFSKVFSISAVFTSDDGTVTQSTNAQAFRPIVA